MPNSCGASPASNGRSVPMAAGLRTQRSRKWISSGTRPRRPKFRKTSLFRRELRSGRPRKTGQHIPLLRCDADAEPRGALAEIGPLQDLAILIDPIRQMALLGPEHQLERGAAAIEPCLDLAEKLFQAEAGDGRDDTGPG